MFLAVLFYHVGLSKEQVYMGEKGQFWPKSHDLKTSDTKKYLSSWYWEFSQEYILPYITPCKNVTLEQRDFYHVTVIRTISVRVMLNTIALTLNPLVSDKQIFEVFFY